MDQHQPAPAAPLGGHQRGAVGKPDPGLVGQVERRLGEHLAAHADVRGHREPGERGVVPERREARRLAPRQRAAEHPAAAAQPHRHQIVGALGEARTGEAYQHAAALEPVLDDAAIVADDSGHVGEHEHGQRPGQQIPQLAAAHLAERGERAFEVEQLGQQRLLVLDRRARDQTHGAPPPALVEQHHRAGAALALDVHAHHAVAQLGGHLELDLDGPLIGREGRRSAGQHPALLAAHPEPQRLGAGRRGAQDARGQGSGAGLGWHQRMGPVERVVKHHLQPTEALQAGGEGVGGTVIDAVAEP